jgi:hypothetical protein
MTEKYTHYKADFVGYSINSKPDHELKVELSATQVVCWQAGSV